MGMHFLFNSGWTKLLINKVISNKIAKKLGANISIKINDLKVDDDNKEVNVHIDLDATMTREEMEKLVKSLM